MKLLTFEQTMRSSGSAHRREDAYKEGSYFERVKIFIKREAFYKEGRYSWDGEPQLLHQVLAAPGNDSNFCQVPQAGAQLASIIELRDEMIYEILQDAKSWYIWKWNLAEGVGLESKMEPPSWQVRTMPPSRAPQPSKCQASASQQGPQICPSTDYYTE